MGRVVLGQMPTAKIHVDSTQRLIEWSASNVSYADILVRLAPGEPWTLYMGCKPDVGPGEVGTCGGREQPVGWLPGTTILEFQVISIPDRQVLATLTVPLQATATSVDAPPVTTRRAPTVPAPTGIAPAPTAEPGETAVAGIPSLYLYLGGGALAILILTKKKRR